MSDSQPSVIYKTSKCCVYAHHMCLEPMYNEVYICDNWFHFNVTQSKCIFSHMYTCTTIFLQNVGRTVIMQHIVDGM